MGEFWSSKVKMFFKTEIWLNLTEGSPFLLIQRKLGKIQWESYWYLYLTKWSLNIYVRRFRFHDSIPEVHTSSATPIMKKLHVYKKCICMQYKHTDPLLELLVIAKNKIEQNCSDVQYQKSYLVLMFLKSIFTGTRKNIED